MTTVELQAFACDVAARDIFVVCETGGSATKLSQKRDYIVIKMLDGEFYCAVGWDSPYTGFAANVHAHAPDINTALDKLRDKWQEKHSDTKGGE